MQIDIPIKTVSTLNQREHFRVAQARKSLQRRQVQMAMAGIPAPQLPVIVRLTRHSSVSLDAHDNLPSAFKHVVDELADWLGVDDSAPEVTWMYAQEKCKRGQTWVTVEVV